MDIIDEKISKLSNILKKYNKVCVAYSGGTDSDFLLNVAAKTLCNNVIAVIVKGKHTAAKDIKEALRLCNITGVKVFVETIDVFSVEELRNNTKQRCYYCKQNIMGAIKKRAEEEGFSVITDGKNLDDAQHYRPGAKAAEEMGIVSPLFEAGFTKQEIRQAAKRLGLETYNKASNSCLVTRFAYNTVITENALSMVESAEELIASLGIHSGRVRVHGNIARIEMPKEYFVDFINNNSIVSKLKKIGFKYVTLDLEGFRSGSMD